MKNKAPVLLSLLTIVLLISCSKETTEENNDLQEVQDFQKSMEGFEALTDIVTELDTLQNQAETVSETEVSE